MPKMLFKCLKLMVLDERMIIFWEDSENLKEFCPTISQLNKTPVHCWIVTIQWWIFIAFDDDDLIKKDEW